MTTTTVKIQPTIFKDVNLEGKTTGISWGFRIYNEFGVSYYNNTCSTQQIFSIVDNEVYAIPPHVYLEMVKRELENDDSDIAKNILESIKNSLIIKHGIFIGDIWYTCEYI